LDDGRPIVVVGSAQALERWCRARFSQKAVPAISKREISLRLRRMSEWNVSGKVAIVTGANTGIGRVTARELARAGAKVFLAVRSEAKAAPVIAELAELPGAAEARFLPLDLGSFDSVRACAAAFLATGEPLHLLVNNAGLAAAGGLTSDGFESAFGVNHLGHFLLTLLLLERLEKSAPARVVSVASRAHYQTKALDLSTMRKAQKNPSGYSEYSVSKLANVLFSSELARRLEGSGVTTYSLHPGVVASDVWRKVPWPFRPLIKKFMLSVEDGAKTTLHCAMAPELSSVTGRYYDKCAEMRPSRLAQDEALAQELWTESLSWTGAPEQGARA